MKLLRCPGYQGGDRAEFGILKQVDPEKDYGGEYTRRHPGGLVPPL